MNICANEIIVCQGYSQRVQVFMLSVSVFLRSHHITQGRGMCVNLKQCRGLIMRDHCNQFDLETQTWILAPPLGGALRPPHSFPLLSVDPTDLFAHNFPSEP